MNFINLIDRKKFFISLIGSLHKYLSFTKTSRFSFVNSRNRISNPFIQLIHQTIVWIHKPLLVSLIKCSKTFYTLNYNFVSLLSFIRSSESREENIIGY